MGNVSHRVPSIHPMFAVAPAGVIIHNAEFATWAASPQGDKGVIDGAKTMAMTALDLMMDKPMLEATKKDFEATAELSKAALARLSEKVPGSDLGAHRHGHGAGGCGCA